MNTKESYAKKLKDPRWQKLRLRIMERDGFTCKKCGDKETTLNVHHIKYQGCDPWECDETLLDTLCRDCHELVESAKDHPMVYHDVSITKYKSQNGAILTILSSDTILFIDSNTPESRHITAIHNSEALSQLLTQTQRTLNAWLDKAP